VQDDQPRTVSKVLRRIGEKGGGRVDRKNIQVCTKSTAGSRSAIDWVRTDRKKADSKRRAREGAPSYTGENYRRCV